VASRSIVTGDFFVIHRVERRAGTAAVSLTGVVEFGRWWFQPIRACRCDANREH
jgi:hypothetical protein